MGLLSVNSHRVSPANLELVSKQEYYFGIKSATAGPHPHLNPVTRSSNGPFGVERIPVTAINVHSES